MSLPYWLNIIFRLIYTTGTNTNGNSLLTKALFDELSTVCHVEVEEDLALIAIIGNNLTTTKGIAKEVFGALDDFIIRLCCYGASTHNLCLLARSNDAEDVIKVLHKTIFE